MSRETAFKAIEFIYNNVPLEKSFTLVPWGGEPLIRFNLIRDIFRTYPQIMYSTYSSGELVNEEMYEWFSGEASSFKILWSLGNAYEKYGGIREKLKALPWMAKLAKEMGYAINLTQTNPENMLEDYRFLVGEGYINVAVQNLLGVKYSEKQLDDYKSNLIKIFEEYRSVGPSVAQNPNLNPVFAEKNMAEKSAVWYKEFGPPSMAVRDSACTHGIDKLFIDSAGGVWPCEGSHINQEGKLGDIFSGIDWEKVSKLKDVHDSRTKKTFEPCASCEIKDTCQDVMCLSMNLRLTGDKFKPYPGFCEFQKALVSVYKQYVENRKRGINE